MSNLRWGVLAAALLAATRLMAGEDCEFIGLTSGGSIFNPSCSPHDPKTLTVATDMSGSFITYDGGANWHMIHYTQLCNSMSCPAEFHPTDPSIIYWVRFSDVRMTKDKGQTWASIPSQPWLRAKGLFVVAFT